MCKREPGRRTGGARLALAVASGAMIFALGGCGQSGPPLPAEEVFAVRVRSAAGSGFPRRRRAPGGGRGGPGPSRARLNVSGPEFS